MLKEQAALLKKQEDERNQQDKTLFDFDDSIDQLSEVSERYKAFP